MTGLSPCVTIDCWQVDEINNQL